MSRAADPPARQSPRVPEELAASILAFLSADAQRFERFLTVTGLAVGDLRDASRSPGFGTSLLDYVSAEETLLLAFAADAGYAPSDLARLREANSTRDDFA